MPKEFAQYFDYVKKLTFYDKPDYKYLRRLFKTVYLKEKFNNDYRFDWDNF
jgi:hypothetical protein